MKRRILIIVVLVAAFLLGQMIHRFNPAHNEVDSRTWGQQLVGPTFTSGSN